MGTTTLISYSPTFCTGEHVASKNELAAVAGAAGSGRLPGFGARQTY